MSAVESNRRSRGSGFAARERSTGSPCIPSRWVSGLVTPSYNKQFTCATPRTWRYRQAKSRGNHLSRRRLVGGLVPFPASLRARGIAATLESPTHPIRAPILNRLPQMGRLELLLASQIRDGPSHLEHAMAA